MKKGRQLHIGSSTQNVQVFNQSAQKKITQPVFRRAGGHSGQFQRKLIESIQTIPTQSKHTHAFQSSSPTLEIYPADINSQEYEHQLQQQKTEIILNTYPWGQAKYIIVNTHTRKQHTAVKKKQALNISIYNELQDKITSNTVLPCPKQKLYCISYSAHCCEQIPHRSHEGRESLFGLGVQREQSVMARDDGGPSFGQWQNQQDVATHSAGSQQVEDAVVKQARVISLTGDPPSKTMPPILKS